MQLLIESDGKLIEPPIKEGVVWTTNRVGTPSTLTFDVLSENTINLETGKAVKLTDGSDNIFFGFLFKGNESKNINIPLTAYDQLRYLKNKDTYKFENMTASEIIKKLAADFLLNLGTIEDTGYKIASLVKKNASIFDMIQSALDTTLVNTKNLYILYDDFGKLTLKNIKNTEVPVLIDKDTGADYKYEFSIDSDTYNQIKLTKEDSTTKKKEIYMTKDSTNINKWGVLQYTDTVGDKENGQVKADALLKLKNRVEKNISVTQVFGDNRVRAGSRIMIDLVFKTETIKSIMLVEKAKHTYKNGEHTMDLDLRSGTYE